MKKTISLTLILFLIITAFTFQRCSSTHQTVHKTDAKKIYAQYCRDCHGSEVTDFNNILWKHGITKKELIYSIADGWEQFGMPSYKKSLSAKQINGLADLFIEALEDKNNIILEEKKGDGIFKSDDISVKLDTIVMDVNIPWGFAQLDEKTFLVTDRKGILYKVDHQKNKTEIKNTPEVVAEGQGGLLDIELHPDYKTNGWIYLSYSKKIDDDNSTTAIIRGKIANNEWVLQENLFEANPAHSTRHHYGSRIVFDKENYVYFSVGDRGKHKDELPQQLDNDMGKIHRLKDDGSIPADNPFVNTPSASKSIYSYGHRNPQGLIYDKEKNMVWENEHGPKGGDEVNLIKKGLNYGWPVISYGINYDGSQLTDLREKEGMEQPSLYWVPSIASCGMCIVTGDRYPAWKGDMMVSSLKFNYLNRCKMKDGKIVGEEKLIKNIGRMRDVQMGLDGYIYVCLENPGMVVRLVPVK